MNRHIIFECEGTRYDFVMTKDPYGGDLVIWTGGSGMRARVWRYFQGDRLQPLSENCSPYDGQLIFAYLEANP